MLKIDFKEEINVSDSSEGGFKKSEELHGIIPEGDIKKWSRQGGGRVIWDEVREWHRHLLPNVK